MAYEIEVISFRARPESVSADHVPQEHWTYDALVKIDGEIIPIKTVLSFVPTRVVGDMIWKLWLPDSIKKRKDRKELTEEIRKAIEHCGQRV